MFENVKQQGVSSSTGSAEDIFQGTDASRLSSVPRPPLQSNDVPQPRLPVSAPLPASPSSHGNKKKIFLIVGIVLFLGLAAGVATFVLTRGNGSPEPGIPGDTGLQESVPVCGDTVCDSTETAALCPQDCAPSIPAAICGDGTCADSETTSSCSTDCKAQASVVCGDGMCNGEETFELCAVDCPRPAVTVVCGNALCEETENSQTCPADCIPPVRDRDGDGLNEEEEKTLGTSDNFVDSDFDGLSDWDEVRVYHTDPLRPDSDDDGYIDGQEVKNGFNPSGPGPLLQIPSGTKPSSSTTSTPATVTSGRSASSQDAFDSTSFEPDQSLEAF